MGSVSLYNISKQFSASVCALDNVSIEILPGELVAILGSSGCGKTTLLRVIAGLEQPTTGQVVINGRDVTQTQTRDRPIGMVFQSYALFPNMTVRQNIAFPLMVRKRSTRFIRERVDELLELVQLKAQADRYPNQISGGQQQRTALARALAPSPAVLLLDEPLSALDTLVRQQLREQIRQIQQTLQITTLFVTHDQSEAMSIADRIAIMSQGKIEQMSSPFELYEAPATQFSASFFGNRNVLELPIREGQIHLGNFLQLPASGIVGERAIVFFRPEDVELGANEQGHPAQVETKLFQGMLTRLQLIIEADGQINRFYATMPSREAIDFQPGSTMQVYVNPAYVRVFPADS
ncbi:MAG: ABC transporter ATP-binding protein [Elainellaceae cyanobacterium]